MSLQPQISPAGALLDSDLATPGAPRRRPPPLAGFGPEQQCTVGPALEKHEHCTKQHGLGAERTMASSSPFLPAHHRASSPSTILPPPHPSSSLQQAALLPQLHLFRQVPITWVTALHFTPNPILRKLPPLETICPLNLIPPLFAFLLLLCFCCNYPLALFQLETDTSITSGLACMSSPPNHLPTFFIACTLFLGLPPVQSIPLFTSQFLFRGSSSLHQLHLLFAKATFSLR